MTGDKKTINKSNHKGLIIFTSSTENGVPDKLESTLVLLKSNKLFTGSLHF